MALTAYEERVIEELEAQVGAADAASSGGLEAHPPEWSRSHVGRMMPSVVCLLGGVALLLVARQLSLVGKISLASGFSAASIALTLVVIGCVMVLASAPIVRRAVRIFLATLGGRAEPATSKLDGQAHPADRRAAADTL